MYVCKHACMYVSLYLCIFVSMHVCMYVCMVLRTCSLPCLALFSSIFIYFCPRISLSRLSNYSGQQLDMKENSNTSRERFVADQAMTAEGKSYHKSSKRATRPDTHNADGSVSRRLCLLEHFAFASTALRVFGRVVWSVIQPPDGTLATHPLRLQKKMSTKSFAHHLALSWCRETKMLSLPLGPSILAPAAFLFTFSLQQTAAALALPRRRPDRRVSEPAARSRSFVSGKSHVCETGSARLSWPIFGAGNFRDRLNQHCRNNRHDSGARLFEL